MNCSWLELKSQTDTISSEVIYTSTLYICGYNDTAGDSLAYHNLIKFTTKDNDNDTGNWGSSDNCAIEFTGEWWYHNCYCSNLNG